ncbi:conserved protein of unknown function [Tenacibaculum sp. 190130A14a]|uniref:Antirestriction protein ArdC n=1 Tax=Tenacibaculum polynesiense TaxID=3137857 RepID=A0ABM9PFX7_9FLAO
MINRIIEQYNALDNNTINREVLEGLLSKTSLVKNTTDQTAVIYEKLKKLLDQNKDSEFFIELSKEIEPIDLDINEGMGIPLFKRPVRDYSQGMNGKINASEIYSMITDSMIKLIEKATGEGYVKEWQENRNDFMQPLNFISKKPYRGINQLLLTNFGFTTFENPFFLTFKQIERLGGKIKKGSKSKRIIYFTKLYVYSNKEYKLKIGTYDVKKFVRYINKHKDKISHFKKGGDLESFIRKNNVSLLKYYLVFNGSDVEGIDFKLEEFKAKFSRNENEIVEAAEEIVQQYPNPKPPLKHGGNDAYYSPTKDYVQMPKLKDFDSEQGYYATLFHEYIHSTGHKSRLDRFVPGDSFGSPAYAKEELVAEFGAVFLSAEAGILWRNNSNHAEYIKHWKGVLPNLKKDNRLLFNASKDAQKASDYILQRDENGEPKYLKKFTKKFNAKKSTNSNKKDVVAAGMNGEAVTVTLPSIKKVSVNLPERTGTVATTGAIKMQQSKTITSDSLSTEKQEVKKEQQRPATKEQQFCNKSATILQQENTAKNLNSDQMQQPLQQKETIVAITPPIRQEKKLKTNITTQKKNSVLTSSDINNMTFDTLTFSGEWADFMQEPAKTMKLAIWGKPKNGKTAGATKLANYLTNFGSVLYNFADQGINKSTQDLWKLSGLSEKSNAAATGIRDIKELDKLCASGQYDFVFIDMINTYIHRTGIKYFEFEEQFLKKYPNISFILIFEVTKTGNFKGDQGWTHLPDALITVDSFVMHNQGRYGVGEYVVWKEGLKKVNPKKYKEFFTEKLGQDNEVVHVNI